MKKVCIAYVLLMVVANTFGQDSSLTAKAYVGILNQNAYSIATGKTNTTANVRVGGAVSWNIDSKLTFSTFGIFQVSPTNTFGFASQALEYRPSKKWSVSAGHIATPVSEMRAFPVSPGGQFETWTQVRIPGAALGLKTKHKLSSKTSVSGGISLRNKCPQYDLSFKHDGFTLAGYKAVKQRGVAMLYRGNRVYSILVYDNYAIANTTTFSIIPKYSIVLWNDVGIDHHSNKVVRYEGGVFKSFELKHLSGLFSVGYDVMSRNVTGYIFVHKSF